MDDLDRAIERGIRRGFEKEKLRRQNTEVATIRMAIREELALLARAQVQACASDAATGERS